MKFDAILPPLPLARVSTLAEAAEAMGFDALWSSETQHDPFLSLTLAAEHTSRLQLGTAVAIAFGRSPATVAYTAWDLAQLSGGRFILGLGTQVRAHIERRFGMTWPQSPVGKLREFVTAVRAFWRTWQEGEPLNVRGEYYRLSIMSPFFNPGPIDHPQIPIYLAGVNPGLCRLAGEIADGLHGHPFHSGRYLREVVRPSIEEGARRASRDPGEVCLAVSVFLVTSKEEAVFAREQIAFYASTPSYRRVMALHGWEEAAETLSALARQGRWDEMASKVTDEMLETFAVVAPEAELPQAIEDRYAGLADRIAPYIPFHPGERDDFWCRLVGALRVP
ncbi:MAG TPA: TIGR03617 family F420-dependent LLM class oxidoreductase [Chloroflexi bacterium]|nr:TIGR03617 family F420-dependent LLM class oxidoreductase [Chloroflexota bacterium]